MYIKNHYAKYQILAVIFFATVTECFAETGARLSVSLDDKFDFKCESYVSHDEIEFRFINVSEIIEAKTKIAPSYDWLPPSIFVFIEGESAKGEVSQMDYGYFFLLDKPVLDPATLSVSDILENKPRSYAYLDNIINVNILEDKTVSYSQDDSDIVIKVKKSEIRNHFLDSDLKLSFWIYRGNQVPLKCGYELLDQISQSNLGK